MLIGLPLMGDRCLAVEICKMLVEDLLQWIGSLFIDKVGILNLEFLHLNSNPCSFVRFLCYFIHPSLIYKKKKKNWIPMIWRKKSITHNIIVIHVLNCQADLYTAEPISNVSLTCWIFKIQWEVLWIDHWLTWCWLNACQNFVVCNCILKAIKLLSSNWGFRFPF